MVIPVAILILSLHTFSLFRSASQTLEMAKILFYCPVDLQNSHNSGVAKKVMAQCKAFRRLGHEVDLLNFHQEGVMVNGKIAHRFSGNNYRYNFYVGFNRESARAIDPRQYNLVYIRNNRGCFALPAFLGHMQRENPGAHLVVEIPTYPFGTETVSWPVRIVSMLDEMWAYRRFSRYLRLIVNVNEYTEIFGVEALSIVNGVDLEGIVPAGPAVSRPGELSLLAVANLTPAHGYDRLLQGLGQYVAAGGHTKVTFHVAGGGDEGTRLAQMAQDLGIADSVVFHGHCSGKALDELYESCDMAVATMGIHRLGLTEASPLKVREYCAKGRPFVLGYRDSGLPENFPFAFQAPSDESPIDIAALIDFYEKLKTRQPDFRREIRSFAEHNMTWESQLKRVLDHLGVA
jgi:glycosyltransferase involved in cell wall biosynthesis